jgi:outer membrane protein OmpA-like peptidoglycan-associated protein
MKAFLLASTSFLTLLLSPALAQNPSAPPPASSEGKPLDAAAIAEKWKSKPSPAPDTPSSSPAGTRTRSIRQGPATAPAVRTRSVGLSPEAAKANAVTFQNLTTRGMKPLYGEEAAAAQHAAEESNAAQSKPDGRAKASPSVPPSAFVQVPVAAEKQIAFRLRFKLDSTEFDDVTQNARQVADIAAAMKSLPETTCFLLEGHTCDLGEALHNQKLSEARALAVRTLLGGYGVNPARLLAAGFGESQPETPNTTETNRALNRRVVIGPIELPVHP